MMHGEYYFAIQEKDNEKYQHSNWHSMSTGDSMLNELFILLFI
jgi:hypothetical protein